MTLPLNLREHWRGKERGFESSTYSETDTAIAGGDFFDRRKSDGKLKTATVAAASVIIQLLRCLWGF